MYRKRVRSQDTVKLKTKRKINHIPPWCIEVGCK
jgi:hypothetical protein